MRCFANHNVTILPTKHINRELSLGSAPLADAKALVIKYPVMSLGLALAITELLFAHLIPSAILDFLRHSTAKCILVQEALASLTFEDSMKHYWAPSIYAFFSNFY